MQLLETAHESSLVLKSPHESEVFYDAINRLAS